MIRCTSAFGRSIAVVCVFTLVNMAVPMGIPNLIAQSLPKSRPAMPQKTKLGSMPESRPLSFKELEKAQGKYASNPYMAGSGKWDPQFKGVDLVTHNFSTSVTDMSFEGGYGIPVNVTRAYSANNGEEGPFGHGWSLSADVRTTAGGLMKSPNSPIRSVPTTVKNRPSTQTIDPNIATGAQPIIAVTATDASGKDETLQCDVDGIITTPAYDTNIVDNHYFDYVDAGGTHWQLVDQSTVTTVDGTVYTYANEGYYADPAHPANMLGELPFDGSSTTPEPSYVLKITKAIDRQGNATNYIYKSGTGNANQAIFTKLNGTVVEQKLASVLMPNGHQINFNWGGDSTLQTNRIVSIDDNLSGSGRTVSYAYSPITDTYPNELITATNPTSLVTTYGYGHVYTGGGSLTTDDATNLLTTITDPRGLTTTIHYMEDTVYLLPYAGYGIGAFGPCVYRIEEPNGVNDFIMSQSGLVTMPADYPTDTGTGTFEFMSRIGTSGEVLNYGRIGIEDNFDGSCAVAMYDNFIAMGLGASHAYVYKKWYDIATQNLLIDYEGNAQLAGGFWSTFVGTRGLAPTNVATTTTTTMTYNFMGNPLTKKFDEWFSGTGFPSYAEKETQYAYWGPEKYFQQKAVRMKTGSSTWRYSFTDYFDNTASAGSKGQTRYVYDPKYGGVFIDTGISYPGGTPSDETWRYQVNAPASGYTYSANFAYDSKGRATDVYKLQSASGPTYVQTHTTYGADTDGSWGQASKVEEDYTGIDRTTQTTGYTSWGVADDVIDAAGHEFKTYYEPDGRIDKVTQVISGTESYVVEYTYGSGSGVTNGQVVEVKDDLSGVTQDLTYQSASGGGIGQVAEVAEARTGVSYNTQYSYNGAGERQYATYSTPNETTQWWYHDYIHTGMPDNPSRAFQSLTKMVYSGGSWNASAEEFHYAFDGMGRLTIAAFAQSPSTSSVLSNGTFYDTSHLPTSRARAQYVYDPSGRMLSVEHFWDYPDSSGLHPYVTDAILGNTCSYSDYFGLKATSTFEKQGSPTSSFTTDHVEDYGYDSSLDYLTSASYDGGSTYTNWTYDAAGNRNDATVVDNLNRATTISGTSRTYDILGNTDTIGSTKTMTWDCLNRMASYAASGTTTSYMYRADGMRVEKSNSSSIYTNYAYDGQMPIEEFNFRFIYPSSSFVKMITYGLGARGIDRIERLEAGGTDLTGYPIYDSHGNNVATLMKGSSADTYTVGDQRFYDAWGGARSGSSTGEPNPRHCGNLGHLSDDESGFVYMRARYYEPGTGRFVSEDSDGQGWNCFSYCENNPIGSADGDGKFARDMAEWAAAGVLACCLGFLFNSLKHEDPENPEEGAESYIVGFKFASLGCALFAMYAFSRALGATGKGAAMVMGTDVVLTLALAAELDVSWKALGALKSAPCGVLAGMALSVAMGEDIAALFWAIEGD